MRMLLSLSVALIATWSLSAQDKKDEKKADGFDVKKLEGTWSFVSGSKAGTKSDDKQKKTEFTVKGDEMTMSTEEGKFVFKMTVVDAKKNPAEVDFEITDGPIGKGSTTKGIVSLDGEELKICYPDMGMGDRPTKFDGDKCNLFVLKKKKADK